MNFFHDFVRNEVVPAIIDDCGGSPLGIIATGSSIGAFNALAMVCRYPDAFHKAICMSGTYDVTRFYEGAPMTQDLYDASPLHFLPDLEGPQLDQLRERYVLLASGQGDYEDIGESWRAAHALGSKGVPNRVDPWGVEWEHNWPTWRAMLPQYLEELTIPAGARSAARAVAVGLKSISPAVMTSTETKTTAT
ncbi:MAG: hypothetical protein LC640_10325 [Frankia sp.]|nr:hypothetical protein [Frankia sp.]